VKVAVIGAGIIGVTTAYELARDGHEVTVYERCGSVAAESSFANAGVVAPGYVTPWAAPGMPSKVLGHLFSRHAPVRVHPTLRPSTIAWLWRWWRACKLPLYQANRLRMQRLAYFSRERLRSITRELKLEYERSDGYLVLLRRPKDLDAMQAGLQSLSALGTTYTTLDAAGCRSVEPDLNPETELHAGIYLPNDEVGNCRQFAYQLRAHAQSLGVRFQFHSDVQKLVSGASPQVVHLYAPPLDSTPPERTNGTQAGNKRDTMPTALQPIVANFEAIVVCAGLASAALLRPHGLKIPLHAIFGYSITAPLRRYESHPEHGPRSALMDERYKVAISRMGARVRVAGSAEIAGTASLHNKGAIDTLYKVLHDWFPGSGRLDQAQVWKGARPMLPDGPPILGHSGVQGLWLNLGHGSSGWALSCGSARLLADSIAGQTSSIDIEGMGVHRLKG
jgi:D-amino-acid dehydrogenase